MKTFSLLFFALLILTIPSCKDKKPTDPSTEDNIEVSGKFSGIYRIEPTIGETLELNEGRAVILGRDGQILKKGRYTTGKATLRIFFSESKIKPDAVYLLDDYRENGWVGRWDRDMKILYRRN